MCWMVFPAGIPEIAFVWGTKATLAGRALGEHAPSASNATVPGNVRREIM